VTDEEQGFEEWWGEGRILKPAGWQPPELGKILFGEMGDKTNG